MASVCFNCGRTLGKNEYFVRLKDGQFVCRDCANRTRILYPLRYTKVLTESELPTWIGKDKSYHEQVVLGQRLDPLNGMTQEEFRAALEASEKAAAEQAEKYAGAKAVIEADHVRKYFVNVGSAEKPRYSKRKVYGVFGKVIHGELIPGAQVVVSHRDRDYTAAVSELQEWDGMSPGGAPIGKAETGMLVIMLFMQEMDFVYPGDTLIVQGG